MTQMKSPPKTKSSTIRTLIGAALLMATSAIGPGFLVQTATFTEKLAASFAFVILISIILDIGAQLNIWRILTVSGDKAQTVANKVFPGAGYLLALLIVLGGLAFNIGNVAGAGLGLELIFDKSFSVETGAIISGAIAVIIFLIKDLGKAMDRFAVIMGFVMIALVLFVLFKSSPPVAQALHRAVIPEVFDAKAIVTLVGGTVGGYITFAGAHRLIDAGVTGQNNIKKVTSSSVMAIITASIMRVALFLVVLALVVKGISLDKSVPPATPFTYFLGQFGTVVFGVILWAAAITSIIGAAYTSVSFFSTFNSWIEANKRYFIIGFIIFSTIVFASIGRPVKVLVFVGTLNGLILPLALFLILVAGMKKDVVGDYKHPIWMSIFGLIVVILMTIFSLMTIAQYLGIS